MSEIEFIPEDNYYYLNSLNLRLNKLIEIKNYDFETITNNLMYVK